MFPLLAALIFNLGMLPGLVAQGTDTGNDGQIGWMSFEEALARNEDSPKMIFVDFYTDWCGWCRKMDANTFSNPQIATLLNQSFYAVKFNAETNGPVTWNGRTYGLLETGRRPVHEIAVELATHDERLGYPSFVVLDEDFNKLKTYQGYKTVDALKQILEYYGEGAPYKTMNWIEFIQTYQPGSE